MTSFSVPFDITWQPGGLCPFCNMSVELAKQVAGEQRPELTCSTPNLFHDEREALKLALGIEGVLTFPVIFIRGHRIEGGYTELKAAHSNDGLAELMSRTRVPFEPKLPELARPGCQRPLLLHQAGGGAWFTYHMRLYGNVLRLTSLFHVGVFALARYLSSRAMPIASAAVLCALGIDCLGFVLFGPRCLSMPESTLPRRPALLGPAPGLERALRHLPYAATRIALYFL